MGSLGQKVVPLFSGLLGTFTELLQSEALLTQLSILSFLLLQGSELLGGLKDTLTYSCFLTPLPFTSVSFNKSFIFLIMF